MDSIEEIRKRLEAAQPHTSFVSMEQAVAFHGRNGLRQSEAVFRAHAPKDMATLLAEIDRLKAENERLRTLAIEQRLAGIEDGVYIAEQEDQSHG